MKPGADPYRLEFELPGLPRMGNSSGRSNGWRAIANERRRWKMAVFLIVRAHRPKVPLKHARLTLTRCSSVSPDPDGLVIGFKPIVDALITAGILENDRLENIGMPEYKFEKVSPKAGKIRVRVEERKEE